MEDRATTTPHLEGEPGTPFEVRVEIWGAYTLRVSRGCRRRIRLTQRGVARIG